MMHVQYELVAVCYRPTLWADVGGRTISGTTGHAAWEWCAWTQWRRYVVNIGGQGQPGQDIKLQISPYVNDFQTLNNPGPW